MGPHAHTRKHFNNDAYVAQRVTVMIMMIVCVDKQSMSSRQG